MAKQPKTYTSTRPVFTGNVYYNPGEPFTTAAPKGEDWEDISPKDASALNASQDDIPADQSLDALDIGALRALAAEKRVNSTGLSKARLIDALKAAAEPRL